MVSAEAVQLQKGRRAKPSGGAGRIYGEASAAASSLCTCSGKLSCRVLVRRPGRLLLEQIVEGTHSLDHTAARSKHHLPDLSLCSHGRPSRSARKLLRCRCAVWITLFGLL